MTYAGDCFACMWKGTCSPAAGWNALEMSIGASWLVKPFCSLIALPIFILPCLLIIKWEKRTLQMKWDFLFLIPVSSWAPYMLHSSCLKHQPLCHGEVLFTIRCSQLYAQWCGHVFCFILIRIYIFAFWLVLCSWIVYTKISFLWHLAGSSFGCLSW